MEWEGDWNGLKAWVRTLFPQSVQLPSPEVDDPDFGFPSAIELLAGSRMNLVGTGHRVECGDLEEEDLTLRVRAMVTEYLDSLTDDRVQATIKLRAFRVVDGDDTVWTERDFAPRTFTRRATVVAPPPTSGVAGTFASMRNTAAAVPAPTPPAGGSWGAASRGQSPALAAPAPDGGIADATSKINQAVGSGEPITMLAHLMMFTVQTVLAEHRFLIDHNAGLAQQLIGVLDNMAKSNATDMRTARKAAEDLYATRMSAEVSRASSERDAEVARLTTDLGHLKAALKATEDRRQAEALAAQAAQAAATAAAVAAAAAKPVTPPAQTPDMRGRLEEKVATAAERALDAVIAGAVQQQQAAPPPASPGTQVATTPDSPISSAVNAAAGAMGLGGLDLSKVTPDMAAMLLKMLPEETRKTALKTVMMMDPHFGAQFTNEVADAVDAATPPEAAAPASPASAAGTVPASPAIPEGS